MEAMNRRRRRQIGGTFSCLKPFIRFWGVFTAIVICGVGVDIKMHGHQAGSYILLAAGLIFFLEIKWIITLFVQLCTDHDSTALCSQCWSITGLAGGWRLAPLYVAIGVALLIWPFRLWLSYVAGCQLIILAVLRLFTIFRLGGRKEQGLLPQYDDSFDKYENFTDEFDDRVLSTHSLDDEEPIDDL